MLGMSAHAALIERAVASLTARPGRRVDAAEMRRAAVAVLLVDRDGECRVPLIVRGDAAPVHGGQIALPGGRAELDDVDLIATAQREAFEELAVPPEASVVLGTLDDVPTPSGYLITPVVASLRGDVVMQPCEREVAGWFEVPLAVFADPSLAQVIGEREWRGARYTLRGYTYGERMIWGATARILEDLAARVG
jgi:8-oxo-dGTP pyrophosphatase MutT (NUDIX family)